MIIQSIPDGLAIHGIAIGLIIEFEYQGKTLVRRGSPVSRLAVGVEELAAIVRCRSHGTIRRGCMEYFDSASWSRTASIVSSAK